MKKQSKLIKKLKMFFSTSERRREYFNNIIHGFEDNLDSYEPLFYHKERLRDYMAKIKRRMIK